MWLAGSVSIVNKLFQSIFLGLIFHSKLLILLKPLHAKTQNHLSKSPWEIAYETLL